MVASTASAETSKKPFWWLVPLLYPALLLTLRLLYNHANQVYGTVELDKRLSPAWWLATFLYFLLDVLLILGLRFLHRKLTAGDTTREFFRHEVLEIVPVWFLFHLMQLFFEHAIADRLESSGLGGLEYIVFGAYIISLAGYLLRTVRTAGRT